LVTAVWRRARLARLVAREALDPLPIKGVALEFFLTIMLNYEALPGKRYYIQYPSLEFCEAGRRKVLEEQRSTIKRVGRIGGLRSIAAICISGKRPTREAETERELDSAIRDALGR
jgi:hypothetical protein